MSKEPHDLRTLLDDLAGPARQLNALYSQARHACEPTRPNQPAREYLTANDIADRYDTQRFLLQSTISMTVIRWMKLNKLL